MLFMTMLTSVGAWAQTCQFPTASGGTGGPDDPYLIKTTDDLNKLAQDVNSGTSYVGTYFKLNNDITYTYTTAWNATSSEEHNFTSIGGKTKDYNIRSFGGVFDGDGKKISGIRIYCGGSDMHPTYLGIFGHLSSGALVKGIVLDDARITGDGYVGGIAGYSDGIISDCRVTSHVSVCTTSYETMNFGGIVGSNGETDKTSGTVSGCISSVTIAHGTSNIFGRLGGIAGCSYGTLSGNIVIGAVVPSAVNNATTSNTYGAIVGDYNADSKFGQNYYMNCTVADIANATNVGCYGADLNGCRQAFTISAASGVTLTPRANTTVNSTSGITMYPNTSGIGYNNVIGYGGNLYSGATEQVVLNLSYTPSAGYHVLGYYTTDESDLLPGNADNGYTLTMTAANATVSVSTSNTLKGIWSSGGTTVTLANDGTLRVVKSATGNGAMADNTSYYAPWYDSRASITSIVIGNDVTTIGEDAFYDCDQVASVTFETTSHVTTIGKRAFGQCSLLGAITLPASLESIAQRAFINCTNLATIDMSGCTSLTTIGNWAFDTCSKMESITLPASVTTLGSDPFLDCSKLTTINVAAGNANFASEDGILYNKTKTEIIKVPKGKNGSLTIPSTITSIESSAFRGTGISALDLNACTSLTTISNSLCYGCTNLQTVTLPASITVIGEMAFQNCSSLQTINLNACTGLTEIGGQAFSGCGTLAGSYTLPSTLSSVGNFAFNNCGLLAQLTFNSTSLTTYGSSVFDGCTNLKLVLSTDLLQTILGDTDHNWHEYIHIVTLPNTYTGFTLTSPSLHTVAATLDGNANTTVAIPTDVKVRSVTLTRAYTEDQVSTWMMPFPSKVTSGSLNFYTFTGVNYNTTTNKWEATMTQLSVGDAVAANTPYVVKAGASYNIYNESGVQINFTLNTTTNEKKTVVGDWTFKGTYEEKTWDGSEVNDYGFAATSGTGTNGEDVAAGDFVRFASGAHLKPMRSYLTYTGGGNPFAGARGFEQSGLPERISVVLINSDGTTTEIGTITPAFSEGKNVWYSLDGIRLNGKPEKKGLYIHNGKKVVIK